MHISTEINYTYISFKAVNVDESENYGFILLNCESSYTMSTFLTTRVYCIYYNLLSDDRVIKLSMNYAVNFHEYETQKSFVGFVHVII